MKAIADSHKCIRLAGLLSLGAVLLAGLGAAADDGAIGDWEVMIDFQGQEIPAEMTISKGEGGKFKGVISSIQGEVEISEITIENEKMSFSAEVDAQGQMMEISFSGAVEGDKITGTILSDLGEMDLSAVRVKAAPDPMGDWEVSIDFQGQEIPAEMSISKGEGGKFKGTISSIQGEVKIPEIIIENGKMSFSAEVDAQGQMMKISFAGTFEGDQIAGTISSDLGELGLTATRAGTDAATIAGTWKLMIESPRLGTLERTMVINDDLSGKYITDDGEFDIKNLKADAGDISFELSLSMLGFHLDVEFKGKLDGDTLKGEYFNDGRSTAEVVAAREGGGGGGDFSAFAGSWAMTADSAIGPLEQELTIDEDGSAKFITDGVESEVTNLRVEDGKLMFNVSIQGYDVEFAGTVEGGSIKGDYLMGGNSVATIEGKRAE